MTRGGHWLVWLEVTLGANNLLLRVWHRFGGCIHRLLANDFPDSLIRHGIKACILSIERIFLMKVTCCWKDFAHESISWGEITPTVRTVTYVAAFLEWISWGITPTERTNMLWAGVTVKYNAERILRLKHFLKERWLWLWERIFYKLGWRWHVLLKGFCA